jgi:hypothetical protein
MTPSVLPSNDSVDPGLPAASSPTVTLGVPLFVAEPRSVCGSLCGGTGRQNHGHFAGQSYSDLQNPITISSKFDRPAPEISEPQHWSAARTERPPPRRVSVAPRHPEQPIDPPCAGQTRLSKSQKEQKRYRAARSGLAEIAACAAGKAANFFLD